MELVYHIKLTFLNDNVVKCIGCYAWDVNNTEKFVNELLDFCMENEINPSEYTLISRKEFLAGGSKSKNVVEYYDAWRNMSKNEIEELKGILFQNKKVIV